MTDIGSGMAGIGRKSTGLFQVCGANLNDVAKNVADFFSSGFNNFSRT